MTLYFIVLLLMSTTVAQADGDKLYRAECWSYYVNIMQKKVGCMYQVTETTRQIIDSLEEQFANK